MGSQVRGGGGGTMAGLQFSARPLKALQRAKHRWVGLGEAHLPAKTACESDRSFLRASQKTKTLALLLWAGFEGG